MNLFDIFKNRKKVLGMNERNLLYIKGYNKPKYRKIADDKYLTKKILAKHDIPTPKLLGFIKDYNDYDKFDWNSLPDSFVIKPVRGIEGAGIEIFYNRDKNGNWIKADKSKFSLKDIQSLASDILDGRFTPYADPDSVIFEERVKPHKAFKYYTYKGTPDVRIIVFNKIPVMAYLRLPTRESKGKANLAQGAIGSGIDMSNGRTTTSVFGKDRGGRGTIIKFVPGTKLSLSGLRVPYWNKMMEVAVQAQEVTNLGFLAVDFLIDRDQGPLIVELTARPGLSIQIANQDGLRWRLKKAKGIKVKSVSQGVRLAKDLFGGEIEESIETISGKELIGIYEDITIYGLNGKEEETKAKIDTGADSTSIDKKIAKKLGYQDVVDLIDNLDIPEDLDRPTGLKLLEKFKNDYIGKYEYLEAFDLIKSSHGFSIRPYVKVKLKLGDLIFETKANLYDREHLSYKIIVGRKSLGQFLIEPSRKKFQKE